MRVNFQTSVYVLSTKGCPKKVCKPCKTVENTSIYSWAFKIPSRKRKKTPSYQY